MRPTATLTSAIALGALLLSAPVFAQWPTVPADTAPDGAWPNASVPAGAGNGGLIVSAWDPVRGVSLVQYLGLNYNDVQPANLENPAGGVLNFGTLDQWSSVFGGASPSDPANIVYNVTSASLNSGAVSGRRLLTTGAVGGVGTVLNNAMAGAASASLAFITSNGVTPNCGTANACIATNSTMGQYAGQDAWADKLNGQLPFSTTAAVGTSLGFYSLTPTGNTPTAGNVHQYQTSNGIGTWLLSSAGLLTYSIPGPVGAVPLPAAVWLLLSGLAGFGTVSRRKRG
jgi:hypothetical protein